jgi:hypothetical protein
MATITKRGSGWFAQVRRKGYPAQYKTFRLKTEAQAWARKHEGAVDAGASLHGGSSLKGTTLRALLDRYMEEVTPKKRSAESEILRLRKLQRDPLCDLDLSSLHSPAIASYRDRRLATVKPGTICRELSLLHHALDVARREWGYPNLRELAEDALDSQDLAWHEAEILSHAMRLLRNSGVPSLPLHDCLIVPESKIEEAGAALIEGFRLHFESDLVKPGF